MVVATGDRELRLGFCGEFRGSCPVGEEEEEDKRRRIMSRSFLHRWLKWVNWFRGERWEKNLS